MPNCFIVIAQGSLKDTSCNHLNYGFFNTKIKGTHHLQGNVQVYNVSGSLLRDLECPFSLIRARLFSSRGFPGPRSGQPIPEVRG